MKFLTANNPIRAVRVAALAAVLLAIGIGGVPGCAAVATSLITNAVTSPDLWVLCLLTVVPAVAFWYSTPWLVLWCLGFVVLYLFLYWRIVRFRTPKWLVVRCSESTHSTTQLCDLGAGQDAVR